jgi:hypothetical protein
MWTWLDNLNVTSFKDVWVVWLWTGTFLVWAVTTIVGIPMNEGTFVAWLGGLTALSGVGAYRFKTMRDTDWRALEIKAGANVPSSTTTVQSGAVIQQANVPPEAPDDPA